MKIDNDLTINMLRKFILLLLIAVAMVPGLSAKSPQRLFESLANTQGINYIYISEAAFANGVTLSQRRMPLPFSLANSAVKSFEMVKADFDGREKKKIVELGNELVKNGHFTLLTETQDGFDAKFTRIYCREDGASYASEVLIFSSSNSYGATLVYITGKISLKSLLSNGTTSMNLGFYFPQLPLAMLPS